MFSIGTLGKPKNSQGERLQSAKGEEKASSETFLPTELSKALSAFMSQGAWMPV